MTSTTIPLRLCVLHNNSSSVEKLSLLRLLDDLKAIDAELCEYELHLYYLYQITYFPVKQNHSDYSFFLTPSNKITNLFIAE